MRSFLRFLLVVFLLFLATALGRNIYEQSQKFREISKVEGEAQKLEKQNEDLKKKLETVGQPESLEKEARDKLGYQKPGEVLFVVEQKDKRTEKDLKSKQNWRLWLDLFF